MYIFWRDMGIEMITAGEDWGYLKYMALQNRIHLEQIYKKEKVSDND